MHSGDNSISAALAAAYLNGQLGLIWESDVARHHTSVIEEGTQVSPPDLYSVDGPESGTVVFRASFGKPSLRFICNHAAVLQLELKECQYTLPASEKANLIRKEPLGNITAHIRVPFHFERITDNIRLLTLEFLNSTLCSVSPVVDKSCHDALDLHLKGYLNILHEAGYHKLFCLPEFNDAGLRYTVDFSTVAKDRDHSNFSCDTLSGIPITDINNFLSTAWLNAMLLYRTISGTLSTGAGVVRAGYHSTWSQPRNFGFNFRMSFAPPTALSPCGHEALITFNIERVSFFKVKEPHPSFSATLLLREFVNWKLTFLTTVTHDQSILLLSDYRYLEHLSEFPCHNNDPLSHELKACLEEFFITDYLARSAASELHILYDSDSSSIHRGHSYVGLDTNFNAIGKVEESLDTAMWMAPSDVDFISAISQAGVNWGLEKSWRDAAAEPTRWDTALTGWSCSRIFKSEFGPVNIQLLSEERVVVIIHLKSGLLGAGKSGLDERAEPHSFSNWKLAFEAPLAICTHSDGIPGVNMSTWTNRFQESCAYKEHGKHPNRTFRHIYMNFADAAFVPELSEFAELFVAGANQESFAKVKTLVTIIREQYLQLLMAAGHHIIHTIPIYQGTNPPAGMLTSVDFHTLSDMEVNRKTLASRSYQGKSRNPVIVITGRTLNEPILNRRLYDGSSLQWLAHLRCGAIYLSRGIFLQPQLLRLFSDINNMTAPVPLFSQQSSPNCIHLLPVAEVSSLNGVYAGRYSTPIKLEDSPEQELHYEWNHEARWEGQHPQAFNMEQSSAQYRCIVSCHTTNRIILPINWNRELLDIQIEGRVEMYVRYVSKHVNISKIGSAVNWRSNLLAKTHMDRIYISVNRGRPNYEANISAGNVLHPICNPSCLLKEFLSHAPDLAEVATLFQQFENSSKFCYPGQSCFNLASPAFNGHGDLIIELCPLGPHITPPWNGLRTQRCFTLKQSFTPSDFVSSHYNHS